MNYNLNAAPFLSRSRNNGIENVSILYPVELYLLYIIDKPFLRDIKDFEVVEFSNTIFIFLKHRIIFY